MLAAIASGRGCVTGSSAGLKTGFFFGMARKDTAPANLRVPRPLSGTGAIGDVEADHEHALDPGIDAAQGRIHVVVVPHIAAEPHRRVPPDDRAAAREHRVQLLAESLAIERGHGFEERTVEHLRLANMPRPAHL